ncbi:MAG: hypothetical protein AB1Z98_16465 [Nannocystaceae bacterium]
MRRTPDMHISILALTLAAPLGCGDDPRLDVFVHARSGSQWALCQSTLDVAEVATCEYAKTSLFDGACSFTGSPSPCEALEPGQTTLRVDVAYTDARLETPGRALAVPDVHIVLGSSVVATGGNVLALGARECSQDGTDCPRAYTEFLVPFTTEPSGVLEVVAGSSDEQFPLEFQPPALAIAAEPVLASLPAAVGRLRVEVSGPRLLAPAELKVTSLFDGIEDTSTVVTVPLEIASDDGRSSGSTWLPAPDRPGVTWSLRVRHDSLVAELPQGYQLTHPSTTRMLVLDYDPSAPPAGRVGLEALDFDAPPPAPRRIVGEPDLACRELWVAVEARTPPSDGRITLVASAGALEPTEVPLEDGRGATRLTLPESAASPTLTITASGTDLPGSALTYRHVPTLPTAVVLYSGPPTIAVGPTGAASGSIFGQLYFPEGVDPRSADIALVVNATDGTDIEPCPTPVPASRLFCDAEDALDDGSLSGDCLLTPPDVMVGGSGAFSIPLTGGLCFTGTVTVDVHAAVTLEQAGTCVGEQAVDPERGSDPRDSFTIDYVQQ